MIDAYDAPRALLTRAAARRVRGGLLGVDAALAPPLHLPRTCCPQLGTRCPRYPRIRPVTELPNHPNFVASVSSGPGAAIPANIAEESKVFVSDLQLLARPGS